MIVGTVNQNGEPVFTWFLAGQDRLAVIDTGFNGDLELPEDCRNQLILTYAGTESWVLANNQIIQEDAFWTEIPFDGEIESPSVSFYDADEILVGTHFLRKHRLIIDFVARTVLLERVKTI